MYLHLPHSNATRVVVFLFITYKELARCNTNIYFQLTAPSNARNYETEMPGLE